MHFSAEGRVHNASLDVVYPLIRDRMVELVPYLDNVSAIEELERTPREKGPYILNRWRADAGEVPAIARKFLKPEMLEWLDYADWVDAATLVHWRIEAAAFKGLYTCGGINRIIADGNDVKIAISGEMKVDASRIPGLPRLLSRKIVPVVESYLVERMKPNMASLGVGVQRFLAAGGK